MANFSATYSGDFTSYIAGKIFDAANMAKSEKQRSDREAAKYGVEPDATKGEFFGRALQSQFGGDFYNRTAGIFDPRKTQGETDRNSSREARYSSQFRYPDRLMKGQSVKDPLIGTPTNVRNLPEYQQLASKEEQQYKKTKSASPGSPISATAKPEEMFGGKDDSVKVRDKKLGVFLAAIAESINKSLSSINDRLDESESGIIEAKDGITGTISKLEYSSSTLEDKLDAIITALREQMSVAKENIDKSQTKAKSRELSKEQDLSSTERIARVGEDSGEASVKAQRQDREDAYGGYNDMGIGYERGGIVSGPKSGYMLNEPLHGTEMIIPLDNNFTRGLPSAVDGSKPSMNERGTTVNNNVNINAATKAVGPRFLPSILKADPANSKEVNEEVEKLGEALKGFVQVPGVIMMGQMASALTDIPAAGLVTDELKLTGKALSDKFGIRNSITDSIIRKVQTDKEEKNRRKSTTQMPSRGQEDGIQKSSSKGSGFNLFNPTTWFNSWGRGRNDNNNGGGSGGRGSYGGGNGGGDTNYIRSRGGTGGAFGLPGTGRVMTPSAGSNGSYMQDGRTVQKFLGMEVPFSARRSGYTPEDVQRYNSQNSGTQMQTYDAVPHPSRKDLAERMSREYNIDISDPAYRTRRVQPQVTPQSTIQSTGNKRLDGAIRNAQDIGDMTGTRGLMDQTATIAEKTQRRNDILRQYMRDAGMSGADESMNMYGKPMGDQSNLSSPSGKATSVAMLNLASQQNALSKMGGQSNKLDPIVINNTQQSSTQEEEEIKHSPIQAVGSSGISAFYPSPVA